MQAYRQDYCDNGSQQQMYRKSQSSQSYLHSSGGSGMHHQQHHHGGSMMHHKQHHGGVGGSMMHHQGGGVGGSMMHHQGGGLVSGGGSMMQLHKTSSMNSHQYSSSLSSSSTTVFGQDAFCDIMPSSFPPGTDPKVIECYNRIDRDGNGIIDDMELQSVLSNCNHSFSMRTVHLLMFDFTHSNKRVIGPKEFLPLLKCLQSWRAMFQRFDRDRNGSIDSSELGQALSSLGYRVSPVIINLLTAKFSKSGHHHNSYRCSLQYDSFIECCLTVKGLTETFNAKAECGKASFCYEEFLLNVLPFIIA